MNKTSTALSAIALGTALSASATPIFSDNFNRSASDVVGNGWSEDDSDAYVSLVRRGNANGEMQLRGRDSQSIASRHGGFSTKGFDKITLSYEWAPDGNTQDSDLLLVEWREGPQGAWNSIASHGLQKSDDRHAHQWASWDIETGGIDDFEFRFRLEVDRGNGNGNGNGNNDHANDRRAQVDNVSLNGIAAEPPASNVPEPGSFALAALGLGLFTLLGRHKTPAR